MNWRYPLGVFLLAGAALQKQKRSQEQKSQGESMNRLSSSLEDVAPASTTATSPPCSCQSTKHIVKSRQHLVRPLPWNTFSGKNKQIYDTFQLGERAGPRVKGFTPVEWLTFCQNSLTCYYFLWKKLNFHFWFSPILRLCSYSGQRWHWYEREVPAVKGNGVLNHTGNDIINAYTTRYARGVNFLWSYSRYRSLWRVTNELFHFIAQWINQVQCTRVKLWKESRTWQFVLTFVIKFLF